MSTKPLNKLLFRISILIAFLNAYSLCSQDLYKKYNLENLDNYFENARQEWKIPGMAIAIVKDNRVILAKGYGVKDIRHNDPVNENTLFGIASPTKAFTAAAIMKLVEQEKLSLDDRVVDYLPYFELYDPYVTNEMTIRDLLCHRSGLETFSGDLLWFASKYTRKEILERTKFLKPSSGFRSKYGYSNIMFLAAGEIVAEVSGVSWDEFIKSNFFEPLEMNLSNTSLNDLNQNLNVATPHLKVDNELIPLKFVNCDNMSPALGINSSVVEMSNWIITQLNKGKFEDKEIFSEQSSKQMWTPQTLLKTSSLDSTMHFHAYGFGWYLFDYHGRLIVNHSGGLDGMISHIALIPEENLGLMILTNSISYLPNALMYKTIDYFLQIGERDWSKEFLGYKTNYNEHIEKQEEEEEKSRIKKSNPSLALTEYTGIFGGKLYGNATVSIVEDQLEIDFLPTPIFSSILKHWQLDTFELIFKEYPSLPHGKVQFILDSTDNVIEFKVDVPNPDLDFTELEFMKIHE